MSFFVEKLEDKYSIPVQDNIGSEKFTWDVTEENEDEVININDLIKELNNAAADFIGSSTK